MLGQLAILQSLKRDVVLEHWLWRYLTYVEELPVDVVYPYLIRNVALSHV